VLAIMTGVAFGLVPALQVAGSAMQETLHEGGRAAIAGRAGTLLRRAFVVAEFGLALSLLAGAGLLLKSFAKVSAVDPGFDQRNLLTANVALPEASYADEVARRAFFDRAIERIASAPGVRAVGVTSVLPFGGSWTTGSFAVEGYTPPVGELAPWGIKGSSVRASRRRCASRSSAAGSSRRATMPMAPGWSWSTSRW
jgi:hypothetical protein